MPQVAGSGSGPGFPDDEGTAPAGDIPVQGAEASDIATPEIDFSSWPAFHLHPEGP